MLHDAVGAFYFRHKTDYVMVNEFPIKTVVSCIARFNKMIKNKTISFHKLSRSFDYKDLS